MVAILFSSLATTVKSRIFRERQDRRSTADWRRRLLAPKRWRILNWRGSQDRDVLFALTLLSGLQTDYAVLIEKRKLASPVARALLAIAYVRERDRLRAIDLLSGLEARISR